MSSDVIAFKAQPEGLSRRSAEQWIRAIMLTGNGYGDTDHMREKMIERDISSRQVMEVLKGGSVVKDPTWDPEYEDWTCVVRKCVSGRMVSVVVGLESKTRMTGVTTYG